MLLKTSRNLSAICMIVALIFIYSSCKKTDALSTPSPSYSSNGESLAVDGASRAVKKAVEDHIRDIYFWYKKIPRSFSGLDYSGPKAIIKAVRQFSIEPGFSQPVDRWSYALTAEEWANVSSGRIMSDIGISAAFLTENDLRVKSVEKGSPANLAGIQRGWKIAKINGSSSININNVDFINNALNSSSSSFTFVKPDGSKVDFRLNAASYYSHVIELDSVYEFSNGKNVGYLVISSFMGPKDNIYRDFRAIFSRFSSKRITDLIVDLRYNGGGYVDVQQRLSNYLIQSANNRKVMQKEVYNDKHTFSNETTTFNKLGYLNLNRIYFIIGQATASASESLINSLKPYMKETLIGQSSTTGKPVGFYPIPVNDWYLFPVSFKIFNANNQGDYFDGFRPNIRAADGVTLDWGDTREPCLAAALRSATGRRRLAEGDEERTAEAIDFIQNASVMEANDKLDTKSFKGMVKERNSNN